MGAPAGVVSTSMMAGNKERVLFGRYSDKQMNLIPSLLVVVALDHEPRSLPSPGSPKCYQWSAYTPKPYRQAVGEAGNMSTESPTHGQLIGLITLPCTLSTDSCGLRRYTAFVCL